MAEAARLLIVDDDFINRTMLSYGVQQQGHSATEASGGREALEILRDDPHDVVLLDLLMPEMDGFEVLEQIKSDSSLREIPVIMVSALDEMDSIVRCIEMGAEDYLPKPYNPVLLKARLDACMEKKRWRDQEKQYLQQVALLTSAAAQIEASAFDSVSIAGVAQRDDELGSLARMLQRVAHEVEERAEQLRRQVQLLTIEVDEAKRNRKVAEVTETDYFRDLQSRADRLRARPDTRRAQPVAAGAADSV